jgi:hypothetical protein
MHRRFGSLPCYAVSSLKEIGPRDGKADSTDKSCNLMITRQFVLCIFLHPWDLLCHPWDQFRTGIIPQRPSRSATRILNSSPDGRLDLGAVPVGRRPCPETE